MTYYVIILKLSDICTRLCWARPRMVVTYTGYCVKQKSFWACADVEITL